MYTNDSDSDDDDDYDDEHLSVFSHSKVSLPGFFVIKFTVAKKYGTE